MEEAYSNIYFCLYQKRKDLKKFYLSYYNSSWLMISFVIKQLMEILFWGISLVPFSLPIIVLQEAQIKKQYEMLIIEYGYTFSYAYY